MKKISDISSDILTEEFTKYIKKNMVKDMHLVNHGTELNRFECDRILETFNQNMKLIKGEKENND